ncbi:plasmid mobilization protein [Tissierella pigra]|uniref:MobC family plasmid mobilization relaxosome protein n=1 Tax=Tissierella pigra TaxID=2607614 RepID=A0A6N7Y0W4_9FIRM|nr:plasmid mobilization relaxosome protein MobC [Tissierella pigra]MSU02138.1 MobC family plasmid mobilization relaxosome protein [Tissierella pigra]
MANRARKNELKVYLSDEEQEIINKKIEEAGIKNKSAYVRKMLCDGLIINVDLSIIKDHNSQISKIGNNLNQITKQLNALNYISPEDVKRVEEITKEIKKMQREILLNFQEII